MLGYNFELGAASLNSFVMFCQQEMLAFQNDKSIEVRKFVIGFIEEAWYVLKHLLFPLPLSDFFHSVHITY